MYMYSAILTKSTIIIIEIVHVPYMVDAWLSYTSFKLVCHSLSVSGVACGMWMHS